MTDNNDNPWERLQARVADLDARVRVLDVQMQQQQDTTQSCRQILQKIEQLKEEIYTIKVDVSNNTLIVGAAKWLTAAVISTAVTLIIAAWFTQYTSSGGA